MAKILITGSHGFLGSHLKQALSTHKIIPFDRKLLLSPYELSEYLDRTKPDYLYHLAAFGNNMTNKQEDREIFNVNTVGLFNLLSAVKSLSISGMVNISTSSVLLPYQTLYAATKASGEHLCRAFAQKYSLPVITLRPFSLYGENDHYGHFIPTVFRSCLYGDAMKLAKMPSHDWVYVGDFIEEMIRAAKHYASSYKGDVVHVGTGTITYNWEIVAMIEEITGKKANITGVFPDRVYDNEEWVARKSLGRVDWAATPILQGLQKVYRSYKL